MKLQSMGFLLVLTLGPSMLIGCKDEEACKRARSAASDAWQSVSVTAGTNRVAPNIGIDELAADKKAPHVEAWGTMEKQAAMIASSFAYDKITWKTADPALEKTNLAFDGYFAKAQFKSFEILLKDANQKYKSAASLCRD